MSARVGVKSGVLTDAMFADGAGLRAGWPGRLHAQVPAEIRVAARTAGQSAGATPAVPGAHRDRVRIGGTRAPRSAGAWAALRLGAVSALALMLAGPVMAQERMKVVTTFTVLADMAANVAGDAADVVSITKPGAEIHGYEPTPQDIVGASDADLILWNGLNLELWFAQFLGNLGDVPSVTLSDGIDPIPISAGSYAGKPNPHAWMGLDNALIYIANIEAAFVAQDPANADTYRANAEAYRDRLRATIEPLRAQIAAIPEAQRWLVTCEGAFSYLARDFGLQELYLWPMNADQMGTPQQVRAVIDGVRENDVPVVFCESTVNTAPAEQVARETGAAYGGVLYVDSLSLPDGPVPTYLDLLTTTATTVATGLAAAAN